MKPTLKRLVPAIGLGLCIGAVAGVSHAAGPMTEHGILTGRGGMTLYTFDKDATNSGKSECMGACAKNWPPFLASASDSASGDYSFVKRDDDTMQWAYKGKPLYFWHLDKKPGDMRGNGFKKIWHVAKP